ncbi:acyltransferase [Ottowia caeni]|uniref:acyltransferase n=1 Tax=Ottowia caeni TaxID=2870339 RepID=UPI001E57A6AC|nr:acyltransferase [Ottowia caeni]
MTWIQTGLEVEFMRYLKEIFLMLLRWRLILDGVQCQSSVRIRGYPLVHVNKKARIVLGNHVVLQSKSLRYHGFMHSPVKLLADAPGAVIEVGDESRLNGACLHAVKYIRIGKRCLFASGVQVLDSNAHRLSMDQPSSRLRTVDEGRPIIIGDDVWLGLNVIVLPGTRIGDGSIIGAGVILSGDIPAGSIVRPAPYVIA